MCHADYPGTTGDGFHGGPYLGILARGANIAGQTKPSPWNTTRTDDPDPYQSDQAHAQAVIDYLHSHDPASSEPLFLWLGMIAPHPPYDTNGKWEDHVNASSVDAPPRVDEATMHPFDAYSSISKGVFGRNYSDAQLKTMRGAYWGAVGEALSLMENVIAAAGATGHLDNTVVLYTSDHGEMSLEHASDYKNSMYEPSARVPLLMKAYNVSWLPPRTGVVTNVTSHIDILPTLAEIAGAALPPAVRGTSLVPYLQGGAPAGHPGYVAMEYHSNLANTGSFALRQGAYKLITFGHTWPWFNASAYPPLLFDVDADPFELVNLAPSMPDVVAAMTSTLEQEWGGAGSIAAIDAQQMHQNLALYNTWFEQRCNGSQLLTAFTDTFKGVDAATITDLVTQWSGSPPGREVAGPGAACRALRAWGAERRVAGAACGTASGRR
jgi:arylsulfatase A-like enzyme